MKESRMAWKGLVLTTALLGLLFGREAVAQPGAIRWKDSVVVSDVPVFEGSRGKYGSEYARLLQVGTKRWLAAYTAADHFTDSAGKHRLHLEIAQSDDRGRSWKKIAEVAYPGRDLDNAQMLQLKDGRILLACRSTRFGETYWLPVYASDDNGKTWKEQGMIDRNEGVPGALFKPDKGLYEPHLLLLDDGRVAVMYANEKHVTDTVPYSQVISQKISDDFGKTWGEELWAVYEPGNAVSRPGMPVWTKMMNGHYILVYEVCGPERCNVYFKTSANGVDWPLGFGTMIPGQTGGPFVLSLTDGRLIVTSNRANLSVSDDLGKNWVLAERPWVHRQDFDKVWIQTYWPSLYQTGKKEVAAVTSVLREQGGHNVQVRYGRISKKKN